MRYLPVISALLVSTLSLSFATAQEALTAEDLIDKLAERKKQFDFQTVTLHGKTVTRTSGMGRSYETYTYHRAGELWSRTSTPWGRWRSRRWSKSQAPTETRVYDGEKHCYFVQPKDPRERPSAEFTRDQAAVQRLADEGSWDQYSRQLRLYLSGDNLVQALRQAERVELKAAARRVGRFETRVLTAQTAQGLFTLYFSVEHGYALIKAEREIKTGDHRDGQAVPEGFREHRQAQATAWVQQGALWIPTEMQITTKGTVPTPRGGRPIRLQTTTQLEYTLSQNDPAARDPATFATPTLPVGTQISYDDDKNPNGSIRFYRWDGEKAVPE